MMRCIVSSPHFASLNGRAPRRPHDRSVRRLAAPDVFPTAARLRAEELPISAPNSTETEPTAGIVLAHEPDFELGGARVRPSACAVRSADRESRIEPRMMEVLIVLARAAGRTVTRDELIDACWGGRIVSDDAIARIIAKLRGLAREFEPAPYALETLPKVGFRLIAADAPVVVLPATGDDGERGSRSQPPWQRWAWRLAAVALLAVAIGALAWWRADEAGAPNWRLEVVRFEARGADPALPKLSTDLDDALIRVMTTGGLEVAPQAAEPGTGASANDAQLRIAGSVDRVGEAYVVDAQVLDRASGLVLLSVRLQRPATELGGFADDAAIELAAPLGCMLEDVKWSRRRLSPTVLGLYLNTCDAITREGSMERMVETARRLVRAAPDLAIGQAMYAIGLAHLAEESEHQPAQAEALRQQARRAAQAAIALDPRTPKAYVALALTYREGGDWAVREAYLRRAHEIDPNLNPGRASYIGVLHEVGRLNAALEIARQVADSHDPRLFGIQLGAALLSAETGDLPQAYQLLDQLDRGDPGASRSARFTIAVWWEDPATGLAHLKQYADSDVTCLATYLAALRDRGASAGNGLPAGCQTLPSDWRIRLLAREGDVDGAYALVAADPPPPDRARSYLYYPEMRAFRRDPRFMPLAWKLGLTDYWLKTGQWPDFCAEPGLPYNCAAAARAAAARGHGG
jgi:DNA-binding winged helix-turn-helix (wHTH) protein/tetratricopeptide (TPR) repeat protein